MFIERKKSRKKTEKINKKYYVLGSNFGPYFTEKFYYKYYDYFSLAEDVCFRDEKSYDMFKNLKNIRKAADIVFSLDTKKYLCNSPSREAIISVIDCNRKVSQEYKELYEYKIVELVEFLKSKSYSIKFMSFCKSEGDEDAINSILNKINNKENISTYFYDGNISEALEIINMSSLIVGTRFHANILGLLFNKSIIPIAYSDKTLDVLNDINFKGKIFDIRSMDDFEVHTLEDKDLTYKLDVSTQKKDAERHFEKLDKVLNRKDNNE